ncbi:unnamed protein product [Aspergillus oryzae]|nr:unnamed protein product [Aspergillus oryzae]GMF85250.1 unnamed protein product [Aspergillus oryzae]
MILNHALHEGINPSSGKIQRNFHTKELCFGSTGDERRKDRPVIGSQGTTRTHEEHLFHPELRGMLVPDRDVVADPDTSPQHTQEVNTQEEVRPAFDRNTDMGIEKQKA